MAGPELFVITEFGCSNDNEAKCRTYKYSFIELFPGRLPPSVKFLIRVTHTTPHYDVVAAAVAAVVVVVVIILIKQKCYDLLVNCFGVCTPRMRRNILCG